MKTFPYDPAKTPLSFIYASPLYKWTGIVNSTWCMLGVINYVTAHQRGSGQHPVYDAP